MPTVPHAFTHVLQVQSSAIPIFLGRPALEPVQLSGREGINSLFEYELLLKTPDALNLGASKATDWDLDSFIGREITCLIELDGAGEFLPGAVGTSTDHVGAGTRQINAIITNASMWGEEGRNVQYRLTLRPWLHLAKLATDCRIYQNKTVIEILDNLLAAYAFPVEKRLMDTYETIDFQCQFNETGFEFFSRLTQEHGINYFFEHSESRHRLVLVDNMGSYQKVHSTAYQLVDYHPPGWKTDAEYIHSFVPQHQLTSGRYKTNDYDYTRPRANLGTSRSEPRPTGQADLEVYQWHDGVAGSHYAQPRAGTAAPNDPQAHGRSLALVRMQQLRTHGARSAASGNLRGMVPGCSFALQKHPRQQANGEYLILDTRLLIENVAQDSQIKNAAAHRTQHWRVEVDFEAQPMREPLRPALTQPKPRSHGPQVARVVGPEKQDIWTDELGRIKVQFPWDRLGANNQQSSCWLRVSSPWAGNQLGGVHIPRIGQEVIVDFIGGDMDLPICTGRVHNQSNLPPWALPGQQALSGFRSRELTPEGGNAAGGRSNHLLLDDTAEKIQAQLKSDHLHSQLSLGHISRVEDNQGRKDERGEGFELRSDGHGALRTEKGLLISTDGRSKAIGGILSRDELLICLEQALAIARDLSKAAAKSEGGTRETKPQQDLHQAIENLHQSADKAKPATDPASKYAATATATATATGANMATTAEQPVLALSGAAGIATATPKDHVQYAGLNIDTVAGRNQQHYAERSILHTAGSDIEQFARQGDIRTIANQGKVIQQAQHNSFEITAEKSVIVTSGEDGVVIRGKTHITLVLEDGTYLRLANGKIVMGMNGEFNVKSSGRRFEGPATLHTDLPQFNLVDQAQQLKLHNIASKDKAAQQRAYKIFNGSGTAPVTEKSGTDAISKLAGDDLFNISR